MQGVADRPTEVSKALRDAVPVRGETGVWALTGRASRASRAVLY